jgi:SulP family sulfate permease
MEATGARNVFQSKEAAIRAIFQKLDRDVCAGCDKRIFRECRSLPLPDRSTPGG